MFKKLIALILALAVSGALTLGAGFALGKDRIQASWSQLVGQPRNSAERRGLVNGLIKSQDTTVPGFIPHSMWDDVVCAAGAATMINAVCGEEILRSAAAWKMSQVNEAVMTSVYDRSEDFVVVEDQVIEIVDREVDFADLFANNTDRLYILGYHYRNTRANAAIIAADNDLNSHVVVLLGKFNGTWWGYHFLHSASQPHAHPFQITDLGEMNSLHFDLVTIWEVAGTELADVGAPIAFAQELQYDQVVPQLGFAGRGRLAYVVDTSVDYFFGPDEVFPRVVDVAAPVAIATAK